MKTNFLITGTSGFLGHRAAIYFGEKFNVFTPSHAVMDIADADSVAAYFQNAQPEFVLHCAAVSDVGQCEKEPERSYEINVGGTRNIARACRDFGAKLIFCSSDQVYFGSSETAAHVEAEVLSPANVYGRQKLEGEAVCREYCSDSVSLRLTWMYDKAHFGASEHGDFMTTVRAAIDSGRAISMPVHDMRGITDVNEVLRGIEAMLIADGGVYNFGAENNLCTYEAIRAAFKMSGINENLLLPDNEKFARNPRNIAMNTAKAKAAGAKFSATVDGIARVLQL